MSFYLFNFGVRGHRIVTVDLAKANLFGSTSSLAYITKIRRLISSNHSAVSSYLSYTKEK